jgi:hypothetical protein
MAHLPGGAKIFQFKSNVALYEFCINKELASACPARAKISLSGNAGIIEKMLPIPPVFPLGHLVPSGQ